MKENYIKALFTAIFALISSILGVLTVPVLLMVACNVLDYATGLMASTYRSEDINSYKSIRGIMKKVCMWLLVIVGAIIDQLLLYASQTAGITLPFTFLVACIVAIWIICNEIISILENIKDMGVTIPAFLIPLVTHVKSQVEDKVNIDTEKEDSDSQQQKCGRNRDVRPGGLQLRESIPEYSPGMQTDHETAGNPVRQSCTAL